MTPAELIGIQESTGFYRRSKEFSKTLGISLSAIRQYRSGTRIIPPYIAISLRNFQKLLDKDNNKE